LRLRIVGACAAPCRRAVEHQAELARVTKKLKGLYDAISDGLRTPGLKDQLLELEAHQAESNKLVESAPPPAPRLHPKLAEVYRATVPDLHAALNDPDARTEAAEILVGRAGGPRPQNAS
jgi:site-specific DNA recombinase